MENKDTQICPEETPCVDTKEMPNLFEMAKNLVSDGGTIVKNALEGNASIASDELREHRWSTCKSCEFLSNDRCSKCGCFMKVKVAFITSKCPVGKW